MMMKKIKRKRLITLSIALVALMATTAFAQSGLPKVGEPRSIAIGYTKDGRGRIRAGDKYGTVQQYLELWEDRSHVPNVVTYVLLGGPQPLTVTWGRGPVNPAAFNCRADKVPDFGEKSLWVATVKEGLLRFQEIEDDNLKSLFEDLARARRDWNREVNSYYGRGAANTTERNILIFLKEKNRKKWLEQGWLQPATSCVRHF